MCRRDSWLWLILLAALAGCVGRGRQDLLQAQLRAQQLQTTELQAKLDQQQQQLELAQHETSRLRNELMASRSDELLPEHTDLLTRVQALRIHPQLTATLDQDQLTGEEALVVQFAPIDDAGKAVRIPGKTVIVAINPEDGDSSAPLGRWEFSPDETASRWIDGFLGTGYQFQMTLPQPVPEAGLVVHVRLETIDGRTFRQSHVMRGSSSIATRAAAVSASGTVQTLSAEAWDGPPSAGKSPSAGSRQTRRAELSPSAQAIGTFSEDETTMNQTGDSAALPGVPRRQRQPIQESTNWTEATMPVYR
jgi:hypothetical protein